MWEPDICFFHMPCDDGFAASWVVKQKWPNTVLHGVNYGLAMPHVDLRGKKLLIADFSYKPADLAALMARGCESIVILDHHLTAHADLKEFTVEMGGDAKFTAADTDGMLRDMAELERPKIAARFDMERSGASLTWEFCFPDKPQPFMIAMIEDRDLWRMRLPKTRPFSLWLRSFPYDYAIWSVLFDRVTNDSQGVLAEAAAIEQFYDQKLAEILPTAIIKTIGKWEGVPVAHAPYAFASDLAHNMLKAHPAAPFAAVVVDAYGGRTYSLRSEDGRQDVSEVARSFGGGGHRNAAGFRMPL